MKSLDEIMSGEGEAMPEPVETQALEPEAPQAVEQTTEEQPDDEPQADERGMVPQQALHAAREQGRKRYTDAVADFENRLKESDERWEKRFTDLMGAIRPQPQPQQPMDNGQAQQPQRDPLDLMMADPGAFVESQMREAMAPMHQAMMANARMAAEAAHKPEVVKEAENAFNELHASGRMPPELERAINGSPNPFAAAVQWHQHVKRQQSLAQYGDDPEAYIAAEVERRLAQGGQAQQQPSPTTTQTMPTSFSSGRSAGPRAAPQWSGPKSLTDIMGGR